MTFVDLAWLLAVLSTGVAAGAMAGHALLLGRFFNWIFESDRAEMFRLIYPPFLQAKKPQVCFDHLFTIALVAVTAYNVLLLAISRIGTLPLIAAGLQWLFVLIFFATGFAALERELLTEGDISPPAVRRFLSLNTRITALSAILLLGSFSCLVLMTVSTTTPTG